MSQRFILIFGYSAHIRYNLFIFITAFYPSLILKQLMLIYKTKVQ